MAEKFTNMAKQRASLSGNTQSSSKAPLFIVVVLVAISIFGFVFIFGKGSDEELKEADTQQEDQTESESESDSQSEEPSEEIEEVDVTEKESDDNAEGAHDGSFLTDAQEVGDGDVDGVTVAKIETKGFESFLRVIFTLEDVEDIPQVTAELISNSVSLKIHGVEKDNSGISPGNDAEVSGSVVSTIFHEVTSEERTSWYLIGLKESTGFYLHTFDDPIRIVIDIEEQEVENGNVQEFEFSTDPQSVTGDASGNEITISGLSYSNQGDVYRVIYRLGSIGTGTLPDAEAEIVDYDGGKAVKVVIKNIYSDFPAKEGYDVDYNDSAVKGQEGSFSSNFSTYYIKLTSEREYQLYYRSAPAQLIVDVRR